MEKKELRKATISKLKNLSIAERQKIEEQLIHNLLHSDQWNKANTIGITVSQGFEWNTKKIIEAGWKADKIISVPKCIPSDKKLDFYQLVNFNQLEVVYYNLLEPDPKQTNKIEFDQIDLLIVPGLLFDRYGFRIGFGGGYYDRLLANYTGETVSLVSEVQLVHEVPTETFDLPVKHLVTETGIRTAKVKTVS
ncbi:5-formyltetrahydrofolate cyclo-ligase [Ornithinibacillus sp. L9]|uniref:5-formyltetrahydrofolate cyclo-ligase n=1 Tax=Ornithinibacillus caprae TaxID=2678566 RepID=A0A6N8FD72_9BACI|nr:5-formyltetrahydrofolate cyclo-ligase [Ornithinibacillus caprae]MUK87121.1 5-formyltetrahydrofolate cyclo-ligase [Ornithinibacillus caprae]